MKVYIIRHGESETNLAKRWTGWHDVHLTEKGRSDAKRVGELLKSISFDRIYSSDLIRAVETAVGAIPGCEIYEKTELLREVNVGSLANQPLSVVDGEAKARIRDCGYSDFGGETQEEFRARILEFQSMLESLPCDNVAVFSHAGWLVGFLNEVVGFYLPRSKVACNNCAGGVFEFNDGDWRLFSWLNLD